MRYIDCTLGRELTEEEIAALPPEPVPTLAEAKAALKAAVRTHQASMFDGGWAHDFGEAGVHTLDLRDADDKANWTLLLFKVTGMVGAGAGAFPVTLRTAANETISISAAETQAVMGAFLQWGESMLAAKWALDNQIDDAASHAALDAIDVTVGWP